MEERFEEGSEEAGIVDEMVGGVEGLKVGMESIEQVVKEGFELRVGLKMVHQDELMGERFDVAEMGTVVKLPVEVGLERP